MGFRFLPSRPLSACSLLYTTNYNLEVKILSLVYVQLYYINNDINRQKYFSKSEQYAVLYFIFVSENT